MRGESVRSIYSAYREACAGRLSRRPFLHQGVVDGRNERLCFLLGQAPAVIQDIEKKKTIVLAVDFCYYRGWRLYLGDLWDLVSTLKLLILIVFPDIITTCYSKNSLLLPRPLLLLLIVSPLLHGYFS